MAAANPKLSEITRDFLSCSICLEPFSDPRQLPCLHTFCLKCIDAHANSNRRDNIFECPACRSETDIPADGATGFKANFFISGLQEVIPSNENVNISVFCDVCQDQQVPATSICIQCVDKLCQLCSNHHHRSKHTHDHRVLTLEEYHSGKYYEELRTHQKHFCTKHPNKEIELYCNDCKLLACLLCITLHHNSHSLTTLHDAAADMSQKMHKIIDELSIKEKLLTSTITKYEDLNAEIDCNKTEIIGKVTKWADELTKVIDDKKQMIIKETRKITNEAKSANSDKISDLKGKLQSLTNSTSYCKTVIQHGSDTEKLQDNGLIRQLEQIQAVDVAQPEAKPLLTVVMPTQQINPPQLKYMEQLLPPEMGQNKRQTTAAKNDRQHKPRILEKPRKIASFNSKIKGYNKSIAFSPSEVLVTSSDTPGVYVFNRQGQLQQMLGQQELRWNNDTCGITVDRDNNILVTCNENVYIYDINRKLQKVLNNVCDAWCHITTSTKKEIILSSGYGRRLVKILDYDGNIRTTFNTEFKSIGVAVNGKDEIIGAVYTLAVTVTVLDQNGQKLHTCKQNVPLGPGQQHLVCVDDWGHVIVFNENASSIHLLSSAGDHLACLTNELVVVTAAAVDSNQGQIVVIDHKGQVNIYQYMDI